MSSIAHQNRGWNEAMNAGKHHKETSPSSGTQSVTDSSSGFESNGENANVSPGHLDLKSYEAFRQANGATRNKLSREVKKKFLSQHGKAYNDAAVASFRASEFSRLDADQEIYLDYVGGSLPPRTVLQRSFAALESGAAGNPHSAGKKSKDSLDRLRSLIRTFFRFPEDEEYEIVLTANASGAITTVAECFPFVEGSSFVITKDNHTSMHSIRHYAENKGAATTYVDMTSDLCIDQQSMDAALLNVNKNHPNLLAYPAQSNATGARHDLAWVSKAQAKGFRVLLDVAGYVPTSALDLSSSCRPDFLCMSFYKIFGYPTGIGCLLAKKSALAELAPTGLKSGSVCYFSGPWSPTQRVLRYEDDRRFEHGTPNYMAFDAVSQGLEYMMDLGVAKVGERACALSGWLEAELASVRHTEIEDEEDAAVVELYQPPLDRKGATTMFNLFDRKGSIFPFRLVNSLAAEHGISLRSGCFCNMAIVQHATVAVDEEGCAVDTSDITTCGEFQDEILSEGLCGAIRVSFGLGSTFDDAYAFSLFVKAFVDVDAEDLKGPAH